MAWENCGFFREKVHINIRLPPKLFLNEVRRNMNIYDTFNNLRYHYENEAVEFKKAEYSMHKGLEYKKCKALLQGCA